MTPHIIWIITGTCGKYSDRPWWVVCWRNTEEEAKAVVDVLNREATVNHARETDRPMSDPYFQTDYTGTRYTCQPIADDARAFFDELQARQER